jgi:nicotinamidase/pyrazinamidase
MNDALIVVDVQKDFCAGGKLACHDTGRVIGPINELIREFDRANRLVIFTRDWHPLDHCSFQSQGGPWPAHCVAGTAGAEFHDGLFIPQCHMIVSKATTAAMDSYSAFDGPALASLLQNLGILSLDICGIATEYCVLSTWQAAVDEQFKVEVHPRAIRPVAPGTEAEQAALEKMGLA